MKILAPGLLVRLNDLTQWNHSFGGESKIVGSECPNCAKPLMLYLTLDCADERIGLQKLGIGELPLLYCMRCALCWFDFAYRITATGIDIVLANLGERMPEWYDRFGDEFPRAKIELIPLPEIVQAMYRRLNLGQRLTAEEKGDLANVTGHYANAEVGGYPIVDVVNQICGMTFLQQRNEEQHCPECRAEMFFLAGLCNDQVEGIQCTYPGGQIVFSFCRECRVINVVSTAS